MNRIRLLPEQVANQIAAGEVIERPASVVKELVENALDAQAAHLTVDVLAGGRGLVRVTDDGLGMSRDDALLCLERHATSKVRNADDLFRISTMGFRGEALPSIASVSRFTLTTRERDSESPEATQVIVHGGKLLEVRSAGAPSGTSVEVRQLFYNLPARRKFLRTEETERAHIHHYLTLAALAHPHVAFTFTTDSRTIFQLPATPPAGDPAGQFAALRERLRALHGTDLKLLTVDTQGTYEELRDPAEPELNSKLETPNSKLRLWGFIGAPGVSRGSRDDQHLFVNRRPIENRALNFALIEGYHTALMKGRYPVACLFLELDPAQVDVNIHPAKREVKFHHERAVRTFVTQAIRDTLLNFHAAGRADLPVGLRVPSSSEIPSPPSAPEPDAQQRARWGEAPDEPSPSLPKTAAGSPGVSPHQPAAAPPDFFPSLPGKPIPDWPASAPKQTPLPMGFSGQPSAAGAQPAFTAPHSPLLSVPLRLVGVIGRLYVVLESDRGLVLMDQHAAHERVLFEQMLDRLEAGGEANSQRLLLPETVELSVRDVEFLRKQLPILSRLGVGLSEFGERTFLLEALPPFAKIPDARRFVVELVDALKSAGEGVNALRLGEDVIAKTVCRHAVKANDPLAGPELENLVADLRRCRMPYTCPHGRPTLIEMSLKELEKKFGRVQ
ncbi:MAG: DNA mismatch repair protein MutL [Limisphaerales bacterium]|nr:MAG: DNA mismatch repair protein MutL [Limisphaerales bacterium]KAG0509376.1 MAG: DNA mismatch repair protein MutL [Limisphaerales bacterium]TXT52121.1 MAG: DNA mismatch repair protein MutL [Limisphaerales bacterium]